MDIVIIAHFISSFEKTSNNRFLYLANLLARNNNVEIISTDFSHSLKTKREHAGTTWPFKITLIEEMGYPTNVCLRRFMSHYQWGKNVKKYLKSRKKPEVIYCAVPSLTGPGYTARYCRKNNIKFIIDVQDLWPEAFEMVFKPPVISKIIYVPFKYLANKIYQAADEIVAVSETYANRAKQCNSKCKNTHCVYLGTDLKKFDENAEENNINRDDKDFWIGYCGTLGASYDLPLVLQALADLPDSVKTNILFVVMGDGPRRKEFEELALQLDVNCVFYGRLPYPKMCGLLKACDIAVNPIVKGAAQSIINKHADYAAAGLPVVNTQDNQEYRAILKKYECGIDCSNNNYKLLDSILTLINDKNLLKQMGVSSKRCASDIFDRNNSYTDIKNLIEYNME